MVYLDFSKGSDVLCQSLLPEELVCYSLVKWPLQWVGNWLAGSTQTVLVPRSLSHWQPLSSGVPRDELWAQHCLIYLWWDPDKP